MQILIFDALNTQAAGILISKSWNPNVSKSRLFENIVYHIKIGEEHKEHFFTRYLF